jgi:hypothetical protein
LNGALPLDSTPNFPLQEDLFDRSDNESIALPSRSAIENLKLHDGSLSDICEALMSVARMTQFMNSKGITPGFWTADMVYFQNYLPVAHQALSIERRYSANGSPTSSSEIMRETIRLTILLFLGLVKRRFRVPPDSVPRHQERLFGILTKSPVDWTPIINVYLWILSTCVAASIGDDRMWVVEEISRSIGKASWLDVSATIKAFIWIEEVAAFELEILGEEVRSHRENAEIIMLHDIYRS